MSALMVMPEEEVVPGEAAATVHSKALVAGRARALVHPGQE